MVGIFYLEVIMIRVEPIQGSMCGKTGQLITTLVITYPRAIHAQLLTHRVFSKNSSSSRAVPIQAAIDNIMNDPAEYLWTGKQAGMQGTDVTEQQAQLAETIYKGARFRAINAVNALDELGIHKQNAARLLEPFQNIRVCLTATEWENWDWLRLDVAAQPEITELAQKIYDARHNMEYLELSEGQWHVPFVDRQFTEAGLMTYWDKDTGDELTVEQAITVSMSAAAQTSYRKTDYSLEKGEDMYDKLFGGKKIHASPSEHQATVVPDLPSDTLAVTEFLATMPEGVSHIDRFATPWSGNFRNFIQNRHLIPNHDKALYPDME